MSLAKSYCTWQVAPADLDGLLNRLRADGADLEFVSPVSDANGAVVRFVVTALVPNKSRLNHYSRGV